MHFGRHPMEQKSTMNYLLAEFIKVLEVKVTSCLIRFGRHPMEQKSRTNYSLDLQRTLSESNCKTHG